MESISNRKSILQIDYIYDNYGRRTQTKIRYNRIFNKEANQQGTVRYTKT